MRARASVQLAEHGLVQRAAARAQLHPFRSS